MKTTTLNTITASKVTVREEQVMDKAKYKAVLEHDKALIEAEILALQTKLASVKSQIDLLK